MSTNFVINSDGQATAKLAQSLDWSNHSLGDSKNWPLPLKIIANTVFNSGQPMFLFWGDEHFCFYNDGYISILGSDKHPSAMGRRGEQVWTEVWDRVSTDIKTVMLKGKSIWRQDQLISIIREGNQEDSYFSYAYSPVFLLDGSVGGALVTTSETTKRVLAEKKLRDTEAQVSHLLNHAPIAMWAVDSAGTFIRAEGAAFKNLGLKSENIIGKNIFDFSNEHPIPVELVERALNNQTFTAEVLLQKRWFNTHFVPTFEQLDQISGMIGISTDITERKLFEEAAHRAIEGMADSFFALDEKFNIVLVNSNMEKVSRMLRSELLGRNLWEVFPEIKSPNSKYWIQYNRVMKEREISSFLDYFAPFDVWVEVDAHPTLDGGIAVFFRDVSVKKRAEIALAESEARFRTLTEASPQLVWTTESSGMVNYANSKWFEFTGFSKTQTYGLGFADAIHPEDVEATLAAFKLSLVTKTKLNIQTRFKKYNGEYRWFLVRAHSFHFLGETETSNWVGTCTDIHDQKLISEALVRSEERLRLSAEYSGVGLWELNLRTNDVWRNERHDKIFGSAGILPKWNFEIFLSYVHPEDRNRVKDTINKAINTNGGFEIDCRIIRIDGIERWMAANGRVIMNEDGSEPTRMVGTNVDITDDVKARERVENSEKNLKLALDSSLMGTWHIDLKTNAVAISPRTAEIFGLAVFEGDLLDAVEKYVFKNDRDEVERVLMAALKNREPYTQEYRIVRRDGQIRWVLSRGNTVNDGSEKAVTFSGILMDITERKNAETDLNRAKEDAESANRIKSAFLANMSHEIRTPLGVMIGFADLITDLDVSSDQKKQYAQVLKRSGVQLNLLINDILDLSKVEAGHLKVELIRFSLRDTLEDVFSVMYVKAKEKGLELILEMLDPVIYCMISDPGRIKQILFNVIGNAIKFTSRGSITVSVSTVNRNVEFEIKDTGIGISSESLKNLFKPFHQADESMTRKFGGTGLGLALSKRLAELLGGSLVLEESFPGRGSVFKLTLKNHILKAELAITQKVPLIISNQSMPARLDGVSILLVEDSPDNQVLISMFLTKNGAVVELADNGLEGIEKALVGSYDVVLMDVQMPVLDGYSATKQLRDAGFFKPIIALTAHAMSEVRQKCLDVGYTDHLPKPVDPEILSQTIVKYINQQ